MDSLHLFSVSFYIRRHRSSKKEYSIYCCIKAEGARPTELRVVGGIKRAEWDLRKGRPKQTNDHLIKLSLYLDSIRARIFDIYFDVKAKNGDVSPSSIKAVFLGKGTHDLTILELLKLAIKKYEKELMPGSLKNYAATRYYVETYCRKKFKAGDVKLKFLTYAFIEELKTFILGNPIKPNDPCTNNGCMKHLERLKKMIAWAYQMRYLDRNVFSSFIIRKKTYESKRLSWEQLRLIRVLACTTDLRPCSKCWTSLATGGIKKRIIPITPGYRTLSTHFLLPTVITLYRMINGPAIKRV